MKLLPPTWRIIGATFINPYQGLKRYQQCQVPKKDKGATFINPYQGLKPKKDAVNVRHALGATFINPYQGLKPISIAADNPGFKLQRCNFY